MPGVLLFFGCEFGLRGLLSPLGAMAIVRFGMAGSLFMAGAASALFFLALGASSHDPRLAFGCFTLYSLSRALYHPAKHAINALLVNQTHRGRQQTLELVFASVGSALGAIIAGFVMVENSFMAAAQIAAIFSLVSGLPFFWILQGQEAPPYPKLISFRDPYRFILSAEFRHQWIPFLGEAATHTARVVAAPLFLFLTLKHFDVVGLVVGAALLLEMVITLWHGQRIDQSGNSAAISRSSWLLSISFLSYGFLTRSSITAFIAQFILQVTNNLFASAWNTHIHKDVQRSSSPLVYASSKELLLCLFELGLMLLFALMAYFLGESVFYAMFVLGALGAHIVRMCTQSNEKLN